MPLYGVAMDALKPNWAVPQGRFAALPRVNHPELLDTRRVDFAILDTILMLNALPGSPQVRAVARWAVVHRMMQRGWTQTVALWLIREALMVQLLAQIQDRTPSRRAQSPRGD
jgi:hypothetical protein